MFKFSHFTRETQFVDYSTDKNTSVSQVAIYNEDDLSHLLFLESADHGSRIIINNADRNEPETPLESPLVIDTHGHTSDDESAILSDLDEGSDLEIPPSPSRRRGGTMSISDDDFEFPVFLGRQQDEELPPAIRPALRRADQTSTLEHQQGVKRAAGKHAQLVEPEHGPITIEGSMPWWPAPIEGMEHDWVEKSTKASLPMEKHVSEIEGPLMTWWPASAEMLQHDWNERFYE